MCNRICTHPYILLEFSMDILICSWSLDDLYSYKIKILTYYGKNRLLCLVLYIFIRFINVFFFLCVCNWSVSWHRLIRLVSSIDYFCYNLPYCFSVTQVSDLLCKHWSPLTIWLFLLTEFKNQPILVCDKLFWKLFFPITCNIGIIRD